jgi:hypothetical protein
MKTMISDRQQKSTRNVILVVLGTAAILLVPLVAMQFTDEVNWTLGDFVAAGALLAGAGLAYELTARRVGNKAHRIALGAAFLLSLLLVWAELAVGIVGPQQVFLTAKEYLC